MDFSLPADLVSYLARLDAFIAAEIAPLQALLHTDGSLEELTALLSRRIAAGELDLQTPGLAEHLWATTLAKVAIDQPTYASYRRETGT